MSRLYSHLILGIFVFFLLVFSVSSIINNSKDDLYVGKITYINTNKLPYYFILNLFSKKVDTYLIEVVHKDSGKIYYNDIIKCKDSICEKKIELKSGILLGDYNVFVSGLYDNKVYKKNFSFKIDKITTFSAEIKDKYYVFNGKVNLNGVIYRQYNYPEKYYIDFVHHKYDNVKKRIVVDCYSKICSFNKTFAKDILLGEYDVFISSSKDVIVKKTEISLKEFNFGKNKLELKNNFNKSKKISFFNKELKEEDKKKILKKNKINSHLEKFNISKKINLFEIYSKSKKESKLINFKNRNLNFFSQKSFIKKYNITLIYVDGSSKKISLTEFELKNFEVPEGVSNVRISEQEFLFEKNSEIKVPQRISEINDLSKLKKGVVMKGNKKITFNNSLQPGFYKYKKGNKEEYFAYGLISVNTEKPLYRKNELVELTLIVLDKYGYLYSNSNITLNVIKPNSSIEVLSTDRGSIVEVSKGIYKGFINSSQIGEYKLYAETKIDNIIVNISSYFNVVNFYDFDILRDVPYTIDPWQGPFYNNFTIIPYINVSYYNFTEKIPEDFTIYNHSANKVVKNSSGIYLKWYNLKGISKIYYEANSPLISPYLYELGKSYIDYNFYNNFKRFYENRSWLFAIDPAAKVCGFESPCICGSNCAGGHEPGDGTIDSCSDGNTNWEFVNDIRIRDLNGSYFGTGDTIEICVDFDCDSSSWGDRVTIGYKDSSTSWANSDIIFETTCDNTNLNTFCINQTLNNYAGVHNIRGKIVWVGTANRICSGKTYRDHDDVNITVIKRRPSYFILWNLSNGSSIGNNLNVIRGKNITIFAEWDRPIQKAIIVHNGNGTFENFNINILNENWTNYTADTSNLIEFPNLGPVKSNITSWDLYFNLSNSTFPQKTFYIYGSMKINQSKMLPYVMYNGSQTNISCQVTDELVDIPYSGVTVNFYNNVSGFLGSALTNGTGWAKISYIENNIGKYTIICNVSDDLPNYLLAGVQNYNNQILTVKKNGTDITPPVINSVTINPSLFSVGGVTNIKANVTDEVNLTSVYLNITLPNGSSYSYSMYNTKGDIFEYNFSNTVLDGIYRYYIYAYDNSSNKGWSSLYSFTVSGIRTYIGIKTTKDVYKIGEKINLTNYQKISTFDNNAYYEEGDKGYFYYSFDTGFDGWTHTGVQDEWEWGVPNSGFIGQCDNGNCLSTDLNGNYNSNSNYFLYSPVFDMRGRTNAKVVYWRMLEVYDDADSVHFESYDGSSWNILFQDTIVPGNTQTLSAGFSTFYPSEVDGIANAQFRFTLYSTGSNNREGWAVDSFNLSFNSRKDWKNDWHYYNTSFGSYSSKVTAIKIGINITSYSAVGSLNNKNSFPDLEVQIFNGTDYGGNYFCNLDSSKTYPNYCEFVIKNSPEFLDAWKYPSNRSIRIRAINLDKNDFINWTNIKREYVTPSIIENHGKAYVTSYLLEQFLNSTGGIVKTMYNNSISLNPNEAKELDVYWNFSVPSVFKFGAYSAYVSLTDLFNNVLQNEDDNTYINDSYTFFIQSLLIIPINPLVGSVENETFLVNISLNTTYFGSGGWCAYNLDNSTSNITMTQKTSTIFDSIIKNLTDGKHFIKFYCNDTDNWMVSTPFIFFNVSEPPRISFVPPTDINNSYVNRSWIYINVSINDSSNTSGYIDFDNSLIGYWNFENVSGNTVYDYSIYNHNGNLNGGLVINNTNSIRGNYGFFDGNNDYVGIGSSSRYNILINFTIQSWIKKGSTTGWKKIFSVGVPGNRGYSFGFNSNEVVLTKYGILDFNTGYYINDNIWHHLVAVFNSSGMYLFVDGSLVASNSDSNNLNPTNSDNSYIGRENSGSYFNGLIDEIMIFNRSLSIQEIKALYNSKINKLQNNFTMLKNGNYSYYACAIDKVGNYNCTKTRIININKTLPIFTIYSPLNNSKISILNQTYFNSSLNFPSSEVSKVWVNLNNNTNISLTNLTSFNWFNSSYLSTGGYFVQFFGKDLVGNLFKSSINYFYVYPDKDIYISKTIKSIGNNTYKVVLNISNKGQWKNYTVVDFIDGNFNFYNFNINYDFTNTLSSSLYNGNLLYWNITLNKNDYKNISYYINGTGDYNLLHNYILGVG